MRFLNRAGKSREPSVAHTVPPVHVTGAGMGKPLQPQRFRATKPALSLQCAGVPPSGIRTVSRGDISPASC
ncbi:hypothetical protein SAMN06273570_2883 [Candidatus Pantoea floridensis]|uniref:Uncharacterized protein n=1 Tax=Candidatus Pantoea floridensis TaxID=1938870 RepID=A0A286BWD8_9GAMM|nr:hypothetical protein BX596_0325 [Enterobacteriaceae bacterium JKS000233]SOD38466.1 hypothetical protein SAMN06273570_2883 [Pantoea floridensis]